MARILVVDDDPSLLKVLRIGLVAKGHDVLTAATGEEGLSKAALHVPEVIVLDLGLPDIDGLEVVSQVREWSLVPIVVLSASGQEERKVAALDRGADDYVTKPFGMAELEARIRTALRHDIRPREGEAETLAVGDIHLDLVHHEARLKGELIGLTAKEFDVLVFLARHSGKLCTRKMILDEVWGGQYGGEAETLRVYVYRLRKKLGDVDGTLLRNSPGLGYTLMVPPYRN